MYSSEKLFCPLSGKNNRTLVTINFYKLLNNSVTLFSTSIIAKLMDVRANTQRKAECSSEIKVMGNFAKAVI
jgi:hypothetical protein